MKIIFTLLTSFSLHAQLQTTAAIAQYKTTGRYQEVIELCAKFQKAYPKKVRCFDFGTTPESRPMKALVVSGAGLLDAKRAHKAGQPILLFQGGIHAGEIDGKDAMFWWLKEALEQNSPALAKVTVVLVPVFNIDGHERFGPNNRPNQIGPEQMGWRVTSQNLNLNRDYVKADTPEMQAMLRLLGTWDPIVYADLHVTDGSQFQHTVSLNFVPNHVGAKLIGMSGQQNLTNLAVSLESELQKRLNDKGYQALNFYPEFVKEGDPSSGIEDVLSGARFSHAYWGLRNRIGLLVETHSWKDYETRVKVTHDTLVGLVDLAAANGHAWVQAATAADTFDAHNSAGRKEVLQYAATKASHPVDFQGYEYKLVDSKISTQKRIIYNPKIKKVWSIPFFELLEAKQTVTLPGAGYVIEASQAALLESKLKLHGIEYRVIKQPLVDLKVDTFRCETPKFSITPNEGHQTLEVTGQWKGESRAIAPGSLFVPIAQKKSRLAVQMLEPLSSESLLFWGFFNAYFEMKEYMEDYVTEDVAEKALQDPEVKKAFDERLKDPVFAKSPEKRLEFFYHRHPSWDERFGLYPVFRVAAAPR